MTAPAAEPVHTEICAWCRKVTREGEPGAPETHGICEECTARYFPTLAEAVREALRK